jgi:hypothetical protein
MQGFGPIAVTVAPSTLYLSDPYTQDLYTVMLPKIEVQPCAQNACSGNGSVNAYLAAAVVLRPVAHAYMLPNLLNPL